MAGLHTCAKTQRHYHLTYPAVEAVELLIRHVAIHGDLFTLQGLHGVVRVGADNVQGREGYAGLKPELVFGVALLGVDSLGSSTQGDPWAAKEQVAQRAQALNGIPAVVVFAVAVCPLVVADAVNERVFEGVEELGDQLKPLVAAAGPAVLDVAEMDDEPHLVIAVEFVDHVLERGQLVVAIGDIGDHRDVHGLL